MLPKTRAVVALAALSLVAACRTATTTQTTVTGTPRLEPAPATVLPPAAPAGAFEPAGRWNLVFDLGGQSLDVVLELVKTPQGGYGGSLSSEVGNGPISKATLTGMKMEIEFTAPDGGGGVMTLNFDGAKVSGTWSASGMSSTLTGARP